MNKCFICLLSICVFIFAEEFELKNGLKVAFEKNTADDEISLLMIAKGGYGSIPTDQQIAGRVAADIVWEAGFNDKNSDQISNYLYENSSDLLIDTYPFYRKIEGTTYEENLESCFLLIRDIFTKPRLDDLKSALTSLLKGFDPSVADVEENFEDRIRLINTRNFPPFLPLTKQQVQDVNLEEVKSFYKMAFSNPSEFILVIVGNFDEKDIKEKLENILGTIPSEPSQFKPLAKWPSFPEGITRKTIAKVSRGEPASRLTFPLNFTFNEENLYELEYCCEVIEYRAREAIKQKDTVIDVGYELPFYPFTNAVWISIQIQDKNDELCKVVLDQLKILMKEGPSETDLRKAYDQSVQSNAYWIHDNAYLASRDSNSLLWGWKIKDRKVAPLSASTVKNNLNTWINLDNYSKIYAK